MSDETRIVGKLRQIRRRHFIMRLAGASGVACCLFGIIAVVFTFESLRFYRTPGLWLSLLGAGLGAAVFVFSFLNMPSWKETVKQMDRNLDLQQRLETAWECLPPREEIDRLLLMDAAERLSPISPASAVPVRINRPTGILLTVGLLAFTILSIGRLLQGTGHRDFQASAKPRQSAVEQPVVPDIGTDVSAANNRENSALPDSTDFSGSSVPGTPSGSERAMEEISDSEVPQGSSTVSSGDGGGEILPFNRKDSVSAALPFRQTAPGETNSAAERSQDMTGAENARPERMPPDQAGNTNDADVSRPSSAGISNRKKIGNSEGAAAGTQYAQAPDNDTGDIPAAGKTTQPTSTDPKSVQDASLQKRLSSDYASRRIEAERALSRENIPPGLKKYIADYFRAIQP